MSYEKQNFVENQILTADHLNHIEDGIENLANSISLGIHTDGAVYVFIDGNPVGTGIFALEGYFGSTEGYVDENNNIILADNLDNGTYTLKYENEDGTYTTIGNFNIFEGSE